LASRVARVLFVNRHTVLFLAGFIAAYSGAAALSRPWANLGAGVLLMGIAACPYVVRSRA
jgi:hypothetical protein